MTVASADRRRLVVRHHRSPLRYRPSSTSRPPANFPSVVYQLIGADSLSVLYRRLSARHLPADRRQLSVRRLPADGHRRTVSRLTVSVFVREQ